MNWSELLLDAGTKQVSHTKLWANVGLAVVTAALIALTWKVVTVDDLSRDFLDTYSNFLLLYLAIVCTNAAASKWLSLGVGKGEIK